MEKEQFECAACGEVLEHAISVSECRICNRTYCKECINEEGLCVPCEETKSKEN